MDKYSRSLLVLIVCMYFWYYVSTYTDWHFIDNVNLIFHEAGHTIFFFAGELIQILAGSGFQILLPLIISIYFFYQQQKISATICLMWVGQNLLNVSVYVGDAVKMQLPLLGGDNVTHDWNYILGQFSLLKQTDFIAHIFYTTGIIVIMIGSILSIFYTWVSFDNKDSMQVSK